MNKEIKKMDKIIFDAKVSDRKILLIPIETIAATPYNPSSRTKEGAAMRKLTESIREFGVIQPIVITADRDLCDGNRRLHAAKATGHKFIECIILPSGIDKDRAFGTVNTTSEKIGGSGWLEACRRGYKTPTPEISAKYKELFGLVGSYGVDMMIEKRLGFNLVDQCKRVKALGIALRLDQIVIRVVQEKLTNKINAITRSDTTQQEKLVQLSELLS